MGFWIANCGDVGVATIQDYRFSWRNSGKPNTGTEVVVTERMMTPERKRQQEKSSS